MRKEIDKLIYAVNGLKTIADGYENLRAKTAFTVLIDEETMKKIEADTTRRLKITLITLLKDMGVDATTFETSSLD